MNKKVFVVTAVLAVAGAGVASASFWNERTPVAFYKGHTHDVNGLAQGAPEHSGGLDRNGCHNASVPYHCH